MFTDLIPIIMPAISFKFQLKYGALPCVCVMDTFRVIHKDIAKILSLIIISAIN